MNPKPMFAPKLGFLRLHDHMEIREKREHILRTQNKKFELKCNILLFIVYINHQRYPLTWSQLYETLI